MSNNRVEILFPVGRIVYGNLYEPNTQDAEGKPLVVKSGPDAGKPRSDYFFAVAYPKNGTQHFAQTEWGQKIWNAGHASFPGGQAQRPDFAWKVKDGDSQIPNRRGRKMADQEGCAGHWIVHFSSGYAPKIVNANGTSPITEKDAVKPGYYVQVFANCDGNGSPNQPGVFINHSAVALAGFGKEIITGINTAAVGFGQGAAAALPAGASATPLGGMTAPGAPVAPPVPGMAAPTMAAPAVPGVPMPAMAAPAVPGVAMPPAVPVAAPTVVVPSAAIMQPAPVMPAVPVAAPVAPAAPVARQMSAKANGFTYEQLISAGWTDATLAANGMFA